MLLFSVTGARADGVDTSSLVKIQRKVIAIAYKVLKKGNARRAAAGIYWAFAEVFKKIIQSIPGK